MIICVCGMIGAGKSTYCKIIGGLISDFDEIGNKNEQIEMTLENNKKLEKVYHITTFPTFKEIQAFENLEVEYVWINTTFAKCRDNILKRKRKRDLTDIRATLEKNREILRKYQCSQMKFRVVNIYETDERW